jgi:prepilin peptidase CpaA
MEVLGSVVELLLMLVRDVRVVALVTLLVIASVSDFSCFKIPNWLTVGGMTFGLIYNTVVPFSTKLGFFWALGGLFIGFLTLLPLYALRTLGAGDVKLMAMIGAFLGVTDTVNAIIFSLLAGGIAALGFALFNKVMFRMLGNVKNITQLMMMSAIGGFRPEARIGNSESVGKLPYGVCISVGTMVSIVAKQLGYL